MLQDQLPGIGEAVVLDVAAAQHPNGERPAQRTVAGQADPRGVAVRVDGRDGQLERRLFLVVVATSLAVVAGTAAGAVTVALFGPPPPHPGRGGGGGGGGRARGAGGGPRPRREV
ncbi:MAG: hypothetical protein F4Y73_17740, partial [Gemmatimonadetes bacterium]|nr:hypothetical protein [Gemmatimonadota bacterium]